MRTQGERETQFDITQCLSVCVCVRAGNVEKPKQQSNDPQQQQLVVVFAALSQLDFAANISPAFDCQNVNNVFF